MPTVDERAAENTQPGEIAQQKLQQHAEGWLLRLHSKQTANVNAESLPNDNLGQQRQAGGERDPADIDKGAEGRALAIERAPFARERAGYFRQHAEVVDGFVFKLDDDLLQPALGAHHLVYRPRRRGWGLGCGRGGKKRQQQQQETRAPSPQCLAPRCATSVRQPHPPRIHGRHYTSQIQPPLRLRHSAPFQTHRAGTLGGRGEAMLHCRWSVRCDHRMALKSGPMSALTARGARTIRTARRRFLDRARSWPGCRTTNRPSLPRTAIRGSPAATPPAATILTWRG